MRPFTRLSMELLRERATLLWAFAFAFISAAGVGAGLLSVVPILKMILDGEGGRSLIELARERNASGRWPLVPGWLIDRLPAEPFAGVVLIISGLLVLAVFGATANFLHMHLTGTVAARTTARIRHRAFERAIHLPLGAVIARGPSEYVARIVRDAAELQRGFIALTSKAVAQLTKGLIAVIVAIVIQPVLTLIAIPTAIVLGVVLRKIGKRVRRGTRGSLQAQEGLLRIANEALQGLRAVKAGTGEAESIRRFDRLNDEVVRHELKVRTARALSSPLIETLTVIALGALALLAARFILSGEVSIERIMVALLALGFAGASLRPLAGFVTEIQAASAPAGRLIEIMDEPGEDGHDARWPALPRHERDITLDLVGFRYPGADRSALEDVTLQIRHGERVAIVGPNGSGKTTLISLLPRLLSPTNGRVLIDGTDITEVSLAGLRRQIGVVTQDVVLFRGSIAENIGFGVEGALRAAIVEASKRAHAHDFVMQLPGGYDADLAEQGASLSGGQRQRIAIARAILRDPSILILDEATSQIDAESEAQIAAALAEFCVGRTTIIVAHRLATVRHADRIIVLEAGRVVEQGRHERLLDDCALYRRLAETQLVGVS